MLEVCFSAHPNIQYRTELFLLVTNGATAILNYSVRKLTGSTIESGRGWVYNINIRYRYLILSVDIKNAETV